MTNDCNYTTLPPGTRLERYELTGVLGQGGCGISYKARDLQLNREVVLKEHFPLGLCRRHSGTAEVEATDQAGYERSLQAFCREARILAGLRHEGIVPIHELFAACGTAFLVMEYVSGENLRTWMSARPSAARIRKVLLSLLNAMEYMHASGVIHRDIKPDNIIVRESDSGVLIDFGAALLGAPTHTLTLVGTPAYAAPEQFQEDFIPDARIDIYSLGRAFLKSAEETGCRLPMLVARSLKKAVRPNPPQRYKNAAEWKKALSMRLSLGSITGILICIALFVILLPWSGPEEPQPAPQPEESTNPEGNKQKAAPGTKMELVNEPGSPYNGLPVGAPMHPIQLVQHNAQGKLIRYKEEKLPPREEKFLSTIVAAQEKRDRAYKEAAERLKNDEHSAEKLNWTAYKLQEELNTKVIHEIRSYLAEHYASGDPYAFWTAVLISQVKDTVLRNLRPILNPDFEPKD